MAYPESLERLIREFQRHPGVGPKSAERLAFFTLGRPPEDVARFASSLEECLTRIEACARCFCLVEAGCGAKAFAPPCQASDGGLTDHGRPPGGDDGSLEPVDSLGGGGPTGDDVGSSEGLRSFAGDEAEKAADLSCPTCVSARRDPSRLCVVENARDVFAFEAGAVWNGEYHVLGGLLSPLDGIGPEELHVDALLQRVKQQPPEEVVLALNPSTEGESTSVYLSDLLGELGLKVTQIAYGLPMGGQLEFADPVTLARALDGRKGF